MYFLSRLDCASLATMWTGQIDNECIYSISMLCTYRQVIPPAESYDSRFIGRYSKNFQVGVSDSPIEPCLESNFHDTSDRFSFRPAHTASKDIHKKEGCLRSRSSLITFPPPLNTSWEVDLNQRDGIDWHIWMRPRKPNFLDMWRLFLSMFCLTSHGMVLSMVFDWSLKNWVGLIGMGMMGRWLLGLFCKKKLQDIHIGI
jgi:hypothetical protein